MEDCCIQEGIALEILDEDGAIIQTIDLEEHGWGIAQVTPSYDQEHFFTANIFTGVAMKIRISDGEILGSIDTGYRAPKRSLAGIAEYGFEGFLVYLQTIMKKFLIYLIAQ